MFEQVGLDESTERVYRAMLERPDAELRVIAKDVDLSEDQTKAALNRLAELALVRWNVEDHTQPQLIDPDVALEALISQHEADVTARKHRLEQSRLAISQLLAAREATDTAEGLRIERLEELSKVRDRLDELSGTCQDEVWSFNPGGPQSPENLARSRQANEQTLRRGVRMRAVYLDSVRNDEPSVEHVGWLTDLGAEVRTSVVLPMRMLIVDRSTAVIPVDDQDSSRGALVVSERGIVAGLVALFVSTWKSAQTFGPRDRRQEADQPTSQELQALRLWAQGGTDATVARALGVSARTVRRISDSLAKRLHAKSRFESGARAIEVGWLTSEDLV